MQAGAREPVDADASLINREDDPPQLIPFPHLQLHHPPGVTDFPDPRTRARNRAVSSPSPARPPSPSSASASAYIELHAASAYSFLRGASLPEHLLEDAHKLGLPALAICDRNGLYGIPRFTAGAREKKAEGAYDVAPIVGCELTMNDGAVLPVLVQNATGYANLCTLLSRGHLRCAKGEFALSWTELPGHVDGLVALTGDREGPLLRSPTPELELTKIVEAFGAPNVFVELQRHRLRGERRAHQRLIALAREHRLPLVATNGVLYSNKPARAVADMFTCLRHHTHLDAAGQLLQPNSERCLKSPAEMARLFHDLPEAITNTQRLSERLEFRLHDLKYQFPEYKTPDGSSMADFLRRVTMEGAHRRYGPQLSEKVRRQLKRELDLINQLGFPGYFLVVWDIVRFCEAEDILIQGRGSAANSAVCYCLGITAVDAVGRELLFERFLSEGREGWPDIDLDLPSQDRRERVIQELYHRYGREGVAMTANCITYRGKSAAREIGKVLNLPENMSERFSRLFSSGDYPHTLELQEQLQQAGILKEHPRTPAFIALYQMVYGLPRHLGQHPGGMVISEGHLSSLAPIERAAMPERTVLQWDKQDCEDLRIIKVDLLGLGMMAVLQETIELCKERGHPMELYQIPKEDPATFEMMQRADTIGVFQIESRAQMATLPRMKPKCFYDVVIEVAIIRPGPIQGDLVHPYLARRAGKEKITYPDERLEPVLKRTLGVPLFQEQLLRIAMVMADFTGSEAEELRRALSFHRSPERMAKVTARLRQRMQEKGVAQENIERIALACSSFALYGFPESHAISFAILAYASAWFKVHRAPEFFCSLLNCQPMGFYSPATLIQDARRHGLRIRPICILHSEWLCTLEGDAIRLGFCVMRGLRQMPILSMLGERAREPFQDLEDLQRRTTLHADELRGLAEAGALNALAGHRRSALWQVERALLPEDDLFAATAPRTASPLAPMTLPERLRSDMRQTGLTTGRHPMSLVRERVPHLWRACDLKTAANGTRVLTGGAVICRQRPGTAHGTLFISLEDETGIANVIVSANLFEQRRLRIIEEPALTVDGIVQIHEGVLHVKAIDLEALPLAAEAAFGPSHDFR
jgi:error-prone DNA polymerase